MKIDNFALTTHQACPLKFRYRIKEGWQIRRRSGALGFGAAFHAGIAEWYRLSHEPNDKRLAAACEAIHSSWDSGVPIDDYRTEAKCISTMVEYSHEYPEETFSVVGAPDNPIIERTFTIALGTYLPCWLSFVGDERDRTCRLDTDIFNPVCACGQAKEPISYGGIFDGLVEFGGKVYALEHKTTSQLGDYYFSQFKPNNQISGYIWGAGQMSGLDVAGAIVNAIGVYKVGKTKFKRQVTTRDAKDISSWIQSVTASCETIAYHDLTGQWPQHTGSCTQYGLCEFHQVDTLSDPEWRQRRLEQDYERRPWDYTAREG